MKRNLFLVLSLLLITVILSSFVACPAPSSSTTTAPPTGEVYHWRMQSCMDVDGVNTKLVRFKESVEAMTDGQIQIDLYASEELVPDGELISAIRDGTIEMGEVFGSYYSDPELAMLAHGVPGSWTNYEFANAFFYQKGFIDLLRKNFADSGVYYLGPSFSDGAALWLKEPIDSLDDLQGRTLRSPGLMGKMLSKFGVTTQHVPYGETYTAAATGLIDGATMGGPRDYAALSLNEVCPYGIYPFMLLPWGSPIVINLDLWDELPDHLKAILEKACAEYSHWDVGSYYADEAALMPELGITWCTLPDEDWERLNNAAQEVWDEWAAENGPDALEAIELLKEWHEEAAGYRQ